MGAQWRRRRRHRTTAGRAGRGPGRPRLPSVSGRRFLVRHRSREVVETRALGSAVSLGWGTRSRAMWYVRGTTESLCYATANCCKPCVTGERLTQLFEEGEFQHIFINQLVMGDFARFKRARCPRCAATANAPVRARRDKPVRYGPSTRPGESRRKPVPYASDPGSSAGWELRSDQRWFVCRAPGGRSAVAAYRGFRTRGRSACLERSSGVPRCRCGIRHAPASAMF